MSFKVIPLPEGGSMETSVIVFPVTVWRNNVPCSPQINPVVCVLNLMAFNFIVVPPAIVFHGLLKSAFPEGMDFHKMAPAQLLQQRDDNVPVGKSLCHGHHASEIARTVATPELRH